MEITIKINIGTEELKELLGQHDKKPAGRESTISPDERYFDEESTEIFLVTCKDLDH